MALNLSIIKSPAGVNSVETKVCVDERGATIGRGQTNDCILADPDRFLSSKHCAVSFESGQFFLVDTSTNGTFINGSPEPLGKGAKALMSDGDTIELGDYQLRVELENSARVSPVNDILPQSSLVSSSDTANSDPFSSSPFGHSDGSFSNTDMAPLSHDEFGSDPFLSDPFGHTGAESDLALGSPASHTDPLAAIDNANGGSMLGSQSALSNPFDAILEDPFSVPQSPINPSSGVTINSVAADSRNAKTSKYTMGETGSAMNQAMSIPESKSTSLIPEDWEDDLLGSSSTVSSSSHLSDHRLLHQENTAESVDSSVRESLNDPVPVSAKPSSPAGLNGKFDLASLERSMPLTDPPIFPSRSESLPPLESAEAFESRSSLSLENPNQSRASKIHADEIEYEVPPKRDQNNVAPSADDKILEGLGIDEAELTADQINRIHESVGELVPVIITGMMQVLRSRTSIKNEFRMNVTTIQPVENNPLKFSADAQEAIESMFSRRTSAYMGPKEAFTEGFEGIGEHQVAIIAGIRAAFKSMMDRFNPEALEAQFDKQNKGVALPGMQKARYWNSYVENYNGFVDNMENTFQYLFGDEFVQAYEDQLRRLAVDRKKRQKVEC